MPEQSSSDITFGTRIKSKSRNRLKTLERRREVVWLVGEDTGRCAFKIDDLRDDLLSREVGAVLVALELLVGKSCYLVAHGKL